MIRRTRSILVCLFGLAFSLAVPATAQPVDSLIVRGRTLLNESMTSGGVSTLQKARALFERATGVDTLAALSHYYVGLADYRLINRVDDEDRTEQFMDDAQTHLERAVELRPEWAEAHALLSAIYGRKAGQGMISGMRYGPKAGNAMQRAKELAPDNPRVILVDAISLYNTPSMFGGDKQKAVGRLQAAIDRFEATTPNDPLAPQWGHADAYAWLGTAHLDAGRPDAAKQALENALDVRPDYAWVKYVLMPKVASAE